MKYKIHASIKNLKRITLHDTVDDIKLFTGKLKFFTEIGYKIHKIERVE